ncbi:hypothetical protein WJX82_000323 [Trebouxia sp. C0006]
MDNKRCKHLSPTRISVQTSCADSRREEGPLSLHCKGCAHCDVKPDNIRVRLAANGTLSCTLVDLGGSVDYSGPYAERPVNMQCTPWYASSVNARINSTGDYGSQEDMDA